MGFGRCVWGSGGSEPFFSRIKWLDIVITLIAISIRIPLLVATLGRYFITLVWHPCPAPLPSLHRCVSYFRKCLNDQCVKDQSLYGDGCSAGAAGLFSGHFSRDLKPKRPSKNVIPRRDLKQKRPSKNVISQRGLKQKRPR